MNQLKSQIATILLLLLFFGKVSEAQISTTSPYSVFGLGLPEETGFGSLDAMGGTGIALESNNRNNNINPASYSGIDSLSLLFEIGIKSQRTNMITNNFSRTRWNTNLSHVALGLRFSKFWHCDFGLTPFSSVGYSIETENNVEGSAMSFSNVLFGSGDIDRVYMGNSFNITKNLALGIHLSYLFGVIDYSESLRISEFNKTITSKNENYFRNFYFDYGLQYHFNINNVRFGVGFIYSNQQKIYAKSEFTVIENTDTLELISNEKYHAYSIPQYFGIGLSAQNQHLTVALDYKLTDKLQNDSEIEGLRYKNSNRFSFGVDYIPSLNTKSSYFGKIHYMAGAYYKTSNLVLFGKQINEQAVTFGFGLPIGNRISYLQISSEIGSRGTIQSNLIKENFVRLNVSFSLHDIWFIHNKIN